MGRAAQDIPDKMPTRALIEQIKESEEFQEFVVAGSRLPSNVRRKKLDRPDLHDYRLVDWAMGDVRDKHVVLFVHGYNVRGKDALRSFAGFFRRLHQAMEGDNIDMSSVAFVGFSWPGDVGSLHFDGAQNMAHGSGVALYNLARDLVDEGGARKLTLVTHSLGAHVGLRAASILGQRRYSKEPDSRPPPFENVLLLAPAVENDVFQRPVSVDRYHFPESAFGMRALHIFASRADSVLKIAFATSEFDKALGFAGPESMRPLKSLSNRVGELLGDRFSFQIHDFSPQSATIINEELHAHGHSDYWDRQSQADYYANFV